MRTYTVLLTSVQSLNSNSILDHYLFLDPVYGLNFTYPNSADGSFFYSTSGTYVYPFTANGGDLYPYGYGIVNTISNIVVGPLKGPYTLIFDPTGLDYALFGVSKIVYDFGDGQSQTVEYPVGSDTLGRAIPAAPNTTLVPHDYYPLNNTTTTYYPTVSVINGNLVQNIFNITATFVPASIYDLENVHLLNNIQSGVSALETVNIFEVESPRYITHSRVLSSS